MRFLSYIFAILVATLPMLWIDDYRITNSIWWTVTLAWHLGRLFGWFEMEN